MKKKPLYATYAPPPLMFERGQGVYLYTREGEAYLDCISGIAVSVLGHCHPEMVKGLTDQAKKLWHLSNMFIIQSQQDLAEKYCEHTFAEKVFFTNSGTEAIECALKTARHYHYHKGEENRYEVLTFEGAFHGRSYGAINAGGNPKYLEGFGPSLPGFQQLPIHNIAAVEAALNANTAAILIEPVQGEGGVRPIEISFLENLRSLCNQTGTLLIYDEVQSGAGRTGKLFAHQWTNNADPDIMAIAKGVGGGFPLGACLATEKAAESMIVGTHGSTYGGNPLATSIGCTVFDELLKEGFLEHVFQMSSLFRKNLEKLAKKYSHLIEEVRGKGFLIGLKIKAPLINKAFAGFAREQKLLIGTAGDNVARIAPPLIITEGQVHELIEKLDKSLEKAGNQ